MSLESAEDTLLASEHSRLDVLFETCKSHEADFLKDFGASEMFLLDGDALVRHALGDELLSWDHGGQFLHLVSIVERFMVDLKQRGAVFEVFFMLDNAAVFSSMGVAQRLARDVVLRHLLLHSHRDQDSQQGRDQDPRPSAAIKIHLVTGSWCLRGGAATRGGFAGQDAFAPVSWSELIDAVNPAFVMTDAGVRSEGAGGGAAASLALRVFVQACLGEGHWLVFLGGSAFSGSRITAWMMKPDLLFVRKEEQKTVTDAVVASTAHLFLHPATDPPPEETPARDDSRAGEGWVGGDVCAQLILAALRRFFTVDRTGRECMLAAVLCAAVSLRRLLPLAGRAFALPADLGGSPVARDVGPFVAAVQAALVGCLAASRLRPAPFDNGRGSECEIADLFDGRLYLSLLAALTAGEPLPPSLLHDTTALWTLVGCRGGETTLSSALNLSLEDEDRQAAREWRVAAAGIAARSQAHAARPTHVLQMGASVFAEQFHGDAKERMAMHENPDAPQVVCAALKHTRDHHFHSTRPLIENDFMMAATDDAPKPVNVPKSVLPWQNVPNAQVQAGKAKKKEEQQEQKKARAAVKYQWSLIQGSVIKRQFIAEKLTPDVVEKRRVAGVRFLEKRDAGSEEVLEAKGAATRGASGGTGKGGKKPSKTPSNTEVRQQNAILLSEKKEKEEYEKHVLTTIPNLKTQSGADSSDLIKKLAKNAGEATGRVALLYRTEMLSEYHRLVLIKEGSVGEREASRMAGFACIQETMRDFGEVLDAAVTDQLCAAARTFGFFDLAQAVQERAQSRTSDVAVSGRSDGSKSKGKGKEEPAVFPPASAIRFQLSEGADYLMRPLGVQDEEKRVSFKPDGWQLELLHIVDSQSSALVVAPTASGKTFISFYLMERCLRTDDDSVVVFVAPTKALVNQVKAEIDVRFSKNYTNGSRTVTGVFTRDFREKVDECQILVTVPQCLGILLLSAEKHGWANRIKNVIFDEVHCIGDEDGEIWEKLILLVDVPFVALSATIGNLDAFASWLRKVERSKGRDFHLVVHKERHNNIYPWVFSGVPLTIGSTASNDSTVSNGSNGKACNLPRLITSFHPLCAVRQGASRARLLALPGDLKLCPEHCLALQACLQECTGIDPERLAALAPEAFFRTLRGAEAEWNISMRDTIAWETALKEAFLSLDHAEQQRVIDAVARESVGALAQGDELLGVLGERDFINANIMGLFREFKEREMMPCMCFHMNQKGCKWLTNFVCETLEEEEKQHKIDKGIDIKIKNLHELVHQDRRKLENLGWTHDEKKLEDENGKITGKDRRVQEEKAAILETVKVNKQEIRRLEGVFPEFTFCPVGGQLATCEEVEEALGMSIDEKRPKMIELRKKYDWLVRALQRGIACHHSGMNRKARMAVETLFRMKHVGAVFCTGTLALGINMPSKTSVFVGDAVYINAMNFRQMSGRAGRRGFDRRGHVVFFGMRSEKILRLTRSALPSLCGNLVLSNSTVLRLIMRQGVLQSLLEENKATPALRKLEPRYARGAARLVELPLFQPSLMREQAVHTFRFCTEFLYHSGLLMFEGDKLVANDLGGLVAHLFFLEPANFAFLALLTSAEQIVQRLCREQGSEEQLVALLSHLFHQERIPTFHRSFTPSSSPPGPSMVILPPLDAHAKADLQRHRDAALSVLADYWDCFAKSYRQELGADDALPLTGVRFGTHARAEGAGGDARLPPDGTGAVGAGVGADSGGCGMLAACTLRFRVRSSFVALSGHDDTFESIAEICSTVRKGLYIDPKMVPVFEASEAPLNAYILDFYKHGQFDALDRYNGINGDEVYDKLRSFELTLKAIWAALKRRLEIRKGPAKGERVHFSSQLDDEKVVDALERIKNHFSELLQKRRS